MSTLTWTTDDGRVLDIRWMDSKHLVNAVNLISRNNRLDRVGVERVVLADKNARFRAMVDEIRARRLWYWSYDANKGYDQLQRPDFRETFEQMCLMRAYLDSGVQWPGTLDPYGVLSCIRHQFESALLSLQHAVRCGDGEPILAKYMEYRLAPQVNS